MLQGPATFVLAILGCGEGEAQCQQVQLAPVRYESQAACLAASEGALARADTMAFPVVVAECRPATQRFAGLRADEVSRPDPRGRLPVRTASVQR